jgi:hypothetical protein
MYSHGENLNTIDKNFFCEWQARIRARTEGFTIYENNIDEVLGTAHLVDVDTLTTQQLRRVAIA